MPICGQRISQSFRHEWGDGVSVPATDTPNGCDQTERVCARCGLVKITVHPPGAQPWRAWRLPEGGKQVNFPSLPMQCTGIDEASKSNEKAA